MKLKLSLTLTSLLFAGGCSTTNSNLTVANFSPLIANAAFISSYEILKQHPEDKGKFVDAMVTLNSLSAKDTITIDDIWQIVNQFPIKELKSEEAILAFNSAKLTLITLNQKKFTELKTNEDYHIVVRALVAGLVQALEATPN